MADIGKNTHSQSAGIKTVILRGELGRNYGRRHQFAVSSPAEAIRALCANFPDFKRELIESQERGVGYKVLVGQERIDDLAQLHDPLGAGKTLTVVPVIGGAFGGKGIGGILLGAALIGASFFLPTTAIFSFSSMSLSSIAFNTGLSLALGGISSMLTPTPKAQAAVERPENKPSYFFDGPVNTTSQGQPIPIGYGRLRVGGAIISAGIDTDEIPA